MTHAKLVFDLRLPNIHIVAAIQEAVYRTYWLAETNKKARSKERTRPRFGDAVRNMLSDMVTKGKIEQGMMVFDASVWPPSLGEEAVGNICHLLLKPNRIAVVWGLEMDFRKPLTECTVLHDGTSCTRVNVFEVQFKEIKSDDTVEAGSEAGVDRGA